MKAKNLIAKMSLALALTGVVGGSLAIANQSATVVRADDEEGKDLVTGFTQFIDDNDIPKLSKSEVEHWNFSGYQQQSKADAKHDTKLDKKVTHIGKYRVSQTLKKYYNACDTKFKRPTKLADNGYFTDKVHKNEVNATDVSYTPAGNWINMSYYDDGNWDDTQYAFGYKKINNLYYALVIRYNHKTKMYYSPQFSEIRALPTKYRAIKSTNYLGSADDIDTQPIPTYAIGKGDKVKINNNFAHSNWRTKHNFEVMGGKIYTQNRGGGDISAINFNKYFKKIK